MIVLIERDLSMFGVQTLIYGIASSFFFPYDPLRLSELFQKLRIYINVADSLGMN